MDLPRILSDCPSQFRGLLKSDVWDGSPRSSSGQPIIPNVRNRPTRTAVVHSQAVVPRASPGVRFHFGSKQQILGSLNVFVVRCLHPWRMPCAPLGCSKSVDVRRWNASGDVDAPPFTHTYRGPGITPDAAFEAVNRPLADSLSWYWRSGLLVS